MSAVQRVPDAGDWGDRLQRIAQADAEKPAEPPKRGHGRGTTTYHVVGGSPELRGVPLIGTGAGALANTRPGGELGSVRKLECELRDMRGSKTALGGARFEVKVYASASGILRVRR